VGCSMGEEFPGQKNCSALTSLPLTRRRVSPILIFPLLATGPSGMIPVTSRCLSRMKRMSGVQGASTKEMIPQSTLEKQRKWARKSPVHLAL